MSEYQKIAIGILVSLIFITLVIVFCVKLVNLYIRKAKEQYIKEQEYNEKELAFQETLKKTIIETQEQVLQNISQDLHDDAGQQLTVINFQLENLKLDLPELSGALAPVSESLGNLSQSIRSISHSLNNQLVIKQNLLKAIASEMERLQKNSQITIEFSVASKAKKDFTVNEKIIIYRIFQECINNSLKHSRAAMIKVIVKTTPKFEMQIMDDGIGFDAMKKTNKLSLGLLTMNDRAASINYHLSMESASGKGTKITLTEKKT